MKKNFKLLFPDKDEPSFHVFVEGNERSEKSTKFLMRGAPTVYFLYQVFLAFLSLFICYRADGYINPVRLSLYNPFKFVYDFYSKTESIIYSISLFFSVGYHGISNLYSDVSPLDCMHCYSVNRMSY